jgi:hypothetical protein
LHSGQYHGQAGQGFLRQGWIPTVRMEIDRTVPYFAVAEVLDSLYSFNLRDISFRARDR